jgi:3-oxoacyl-[acyl-carrier protein] reductase
LPFRPLPFRPSFLQSCNSAILQFMDLGLAGKVAIVTGSSRGLGLASAAALVREGCRVTICARGGPRLAEAATELQRVAVESLGDVGTAFNTVLPVVADLATSDGIESVVMRTVDAFGGIDILVNNVGLARGAGIGDTGDAEWREAFDQTLFPAIRASRLAVPLMRQRGGGAIVIIASIWGRESGGRMTYNAVKAAEISLAKSMARELARDNIRVNSIAPGSISFPGGTWHRRQQEDPSGMADFISRELPFGRFGRPEEVGAVVAFLVSPRASWISGASVPVDGCQSRSQI